MDMSLDGELWGGRGTFEMIQGLVQRNTTDERDWENVVFQGE